MRIVSSDTTAAWLAPDKTGINRRGVARATIQKLDMKTVNYDLAKVAFSQHKGTGKFSTAMFGQAHKPIELPNVKSVRFTRSVDSDAATCVITLWNCAPLEMGTEPEDSHYFESVGWYTPTRAQDSDGRDRWDQTPNAWQDMLIPDRVIKTYEGYGADFTVGPEVDDHAYPSGVWLIDDIEFTHDGLITVQCRDFARLLLEQICFPPVVPFNEYPLIWDPYRNIVNPPVTTSTSGWHHPAYDTDSNKPYVGRGFTDGGMPYVDGRGGVLGHYGSHAFDGSMSSYWLSVGNYPSWESAYEYVQGKFSERTVGAVKVTAWGGPYVIYVSVQAEDVWLGAHDIPYEDRSVDTEADIRFVTQVRIGKGETKVIKLPKAYHGVEKVRITFTQLYNSGIGQYKYRAGCHDVQISSSATHTVPGGTHVEGNYGDMTSIVKWFLAWAGFYWPAGSTGLAYVKYTDGTKVTIAPPSRDSIFPAGRVWGDFEQTGTAGKVTLGTEIWDKKSIMDAISYVRDIVAFLFFVDETGGAVWRSPNIWQKGNYLSSPDGGPHVGRTSTIIEVDERTTLLAYRARLSGRNLRERNFVANTTGKVGAVAKGFNPNPSGMRRVLVYTDQGFQTSQECQIMADLIAVRQMFTYRVGTLTIAGNPAIQVDDQIRIFERTTGESYLHYVHSIDCEIDNTTGRYTYNLETHWLGKEPFSNWVINPALLSEETRAYLRAIGKI